MWPGPVAPSLIAIVPCITGSVNVLFVKLSVVALPTSVSVALGNVKVLSLVSELTLKIVLIPVAVSSKSNANVLSLFVVNLTTPEPLACKFKSIFASPPVALIVGPLVVAALATVISFTAVVVWENLINSSPAASAMNPVSANLGSVNVLFVKVSVVFLPTNVSLASIGNVNVKLDAIVAGADKVIVLVPLSESS